jgi:hypothetical protein
MNTETKVPEPMTQYEKATLDSVDNAIFAFVVCFICWCIFR